MSGPYDWIFREPDASASEPTFADWWAALSGEDRYLVMDCVRLDEVDRLPQLGQARPAPAPLVEAGRPSRALSDFVRRTPEYELRFAMADDTARKDDIPIGPSNVPDAHSHTQPITDKE